MPKSKPRNKLTFSHKFRNVIKHRTAADVTLKTLNAMCKFLTSLSKEEQLRQKASILKTIAKYWNINKHGPLNLPPDLNAETFHYNLYIGPNNPVDTSSKTAQTLL